MPGAWSRAGVHADHNERCACSDADDIQPKLPACPRKRPRASVVDVPESDTDVNLTASACTSQSGGSGELDHAPAADGTSTTAPHKNAEACESAGAIDSSEHQDVLTLHAEDMVLLGRHLARTYGMFAWRVHPLICLPREVYPDGVDSSVGLFQIGRAHV